jgi:hypothetical protein
MERIYFFSVSLTLNEEVPCAHRPSPIARRPRIIWGAFVLLTLAAVGFSVARRRPEKSWAIPDLINHLESHGVTLNVLYHQPDDPGEGCYLSTHSLTREDASKLVMNPVCVDKWTGVIFLFPQRKGLLFLPDEEIETWGECGLLLGGLVLFGDPELLRKIAETADSPR